MRLPVILQADRSECALACLAMVAASYGYRASLREYRAKFRLSTRGMTLRRLLQCADHIGLEGRAVRIELDELAKLRVPAILHWDMDHFVVLKSVRRDRVTVIDPAAGTRHLSRSDVGGSFTGVALELAPAPEFAIKKDVQTLRLSAFLPAFRGLGRPLAVVFVLTLALQAFALLMPLNTQFTVDQGIRQGDMSIVALLAVGFGLVSIVSALTGYFRTLLVLYVGNTSAFRVVTGITHHMLRLSDTWFTGRHTGDILSRFGSATPIRRFLMTGAFAMLVDALLGLGALMIVFAYSWDLALAICAFIAAFAALNGSTYRRFRNLTHESITTGALENTALIENVERHRAIKLLGAEDHRENAWGERYVDSINASARLARFGAHVGLAGAFLGSGETLVMLLLGAQKVIDGEFTLGQLFAFSSYGAMLSGRVHALIGSLVGLRMLRLHQERIADIALEPREVATSRLGRKQELAGRVELRGVSYSYNDEEGTVFEGIDLVVAAGEFVAIEGHSGSGKSTLVKLLCKLIEPSAGEILIDDVALRQLDTADYRRQLGVVMQDDDLFSGTLLENIAADDTDPDADRAQWAARMACIHDDIQRMPMQYSTLVGHMGSTLSGGQRQRLVIARALYRRPRLILFDEGTAHLNDSLQQQVLTNVLELGATVIAATHDPRVLERARRTVALRSG